MKAFITLRVPLGYWTGLYPQFATLSESAQDLVMRKHIKAEERAWAGTNIQPVITVVVEAIPEVRMDLSQVPELVKAHFHRKAMAYNAKPKTSLR